MNEEWEDMTLDEQREWENEYYEYIYGNNKFAEWYCRMVNNIKKVLK